ncbi:MAG: hypothetical protein FJZ80_00120 [Bacteroidetes bacterium]|nr:hypothetical protein [Bacteroidota bacterium]MBM3423942.1 hypothetical protein [Bacteroidota bacterium]
MVRKVILFLLLVGCAFGCKKKQANGGLGSFHYGYFPIQQGAYWIYQSVEITHDENAPVAHDTSVYYLKTEIGDTLYDNEGRLVYKFNRYKRNGIFNPWILTDVWTTVLDDNRAEIVEENIRRVALRFPVKTATTWDPNQFNVLASKQAFYEKIHTPFSTGFVNADSSAHAVTIKKLTLVTYEHQFEVYGKNIGLMTKYFKDLQISNFDTLNIKQGKELFLNLLEYGQ